MEPEYWQEKYNELEDKYLRLQEDYEAMAAALKDILAKTRDALKAAL